MVVRELTAGDLGDEVLVDLIRHDDPLGVLSIYVDGVSARRGNRHQKPACRTGAQRSGPRVAGRADALSATLRRIWATVERFLDPRADGRGHALFAWLGGAELVSVSSRLRLPNRVVLDSTPFIHPLLELADAGARRASF